jgi:hypothetical protein
MREEREGLGESEEKVQNRRALRPQSSDLCDHMSFGRHSFHHPGVNQAAEKANGALKTLYSSRPDRHMWTLLQPSFIHGLDNVKTTVLR